MPYLFLLPVIGQTVLSLGLNVCLWWDVSDIVSTVCISSPFFTKSWLSLDFVTTPRPWTRFEAKMGRNNTVNWKSFIWLFIITMQHLCLFLLDHLNTLRGWELAYFRVLCPLPVFFRIQLFQILVKSFETCCSPLFLKTSRMATCRRQMTLAQNTFHVSHTKWASLSRKATIQRRLEYKSRTSFPAVKILMLHDHKTQKDHFRFLESVPWII